MSDRDLDIMNSRIHDYEMKAIETRDKLIELWKKHHPKAAEESSNYLHPLILVEARKFRPDEPDEIWMNDIYNVTVRKHKKDPVFGSEAGMIQLGISSHDGTAKHDWRDFQSIKNQLAGEECEAFELYPSEARLLDPSNYYTLWCFPGIRRLKVGQEIRRVVEQDAAYAPQRKLSRDKE